MAIDKVYCLEQLTPAQQICLNWVPDESRVLEFGCATGLVTRILRDEKGCTVTGFEYSSRAAEQAAPYCEQIVVGDIENAENWAALHPPYDVVLFGDVLEHLSQPGVVLKLSSTLLCGNGQALISVPNVAHYTVRRALLFGHFDYSQYGIMDDTHLRFFTEKTLRQMISGAGFEVEEMQATKLAYKGDRFCERIGAGWLKQHMNALVDRCFPSAIAWQWVARCALPLRPVEATGSTMFTPHKTIAEETRD